MYKYNALYTIALNELNKPDLQTLSSIHPNDRGLLLGDGLFETILIKNRKLVFLNAHIRRMMISLKRINIPFLVDWKRLIDFIEDDLIDSNVKNGALRITITRGQSDSFLVSEDNKTTIIVSIKEIDEPKENIHLVIVGERKNEQSILAGIKSTNYLSNLSALQEAKRQNADEALMLNSKGEIAEGSMSNFFMVKKNELITTPIESGALPGITRGVLLSLASTLGLQESARTISPEEAFTADEIFMTNSLKGIIPVNKFEKIELPGKEGEVTKRLKLALQEEMERD